LADLEAIEESDDLTHDQVMKKMVLIKESLQLLDQEEMYWMNRCHEQWLLKGDSNTKYFHTIANGRKRKNIILFLENGGIVIEGMKTY
jgi:mannosylglycoprotein endo-beta-mannosidase